MVNIESGVTYKLINAKAGTSLDLSGSDNRSIIGYDFHDGDNQRWRLEQDESGWIFRNVGTGLFLAVDGLAEDGTPVIASENPTQWDIWPDEEDNSVHRVFVPNTRFNIDLSDHGNPTPGTPVTLWGKWEGRNQCWRFELA